ncbi:hypothetical protein SCUP515_01220 [Seiridium cupressi]
MDDNPQTNALKNWYQSRGTRLGSHYLMGEARHFGWWDKDTTWPFPLRPALRRMEHQLAFRLDLPPESYVLDLGCGAGGVAFTMAKNFGLRVRGIDITPAHLKLASEYISAVVKDGEIDAGRVTVEQMDFNHLETIPDASMDGAYSMETLVHSTDLKGLFVGLFRVLRPGAHIAHGEYECTLPDKDSRLTQQLVRILDNSGMPRELAPGIWKRTLEEAGFVDIQIEDVTWHIAPLARLFFALSVVPGVFYHLFRLDRYFIGTASATFIPFIALKSFPSYLMISARKPDEGESFEARSPTEEETPPVREDFKWTWALFGRPPEPRRGSQGNCIKEQEPREGSGLLPMA